jgi:hypothetical protein
MVKKKVKQKKRVSKKPKPKTKIGLVKGNEFTIPKYIMPKKTLFQALIHDETTGLLIIIPALVISIIVLWKVMEYYGSP